MIPGAKHKPTSPYCRQMRLREMLVVFLLVLPTFAINTRGQMHTAKPPRSTQQAIVVKGKVTDHLTGRMLSGIQITVAGDTQRTHTNKLGEFILYFPMQMADSTVTITATPSNAASVAALNTYIAGETITLSGKKLVAIHLYRYPEEHHPPTEIKWKKPIYYKQPILLTPEQIKYGRHLPSDVHTPTPSTYQQQRGRRRTFSYAPPVVAVPPLPIYPVHTPFFKKLTYRWKTRKAK